MLKGWDKMSGYKRATVTISEEEYQRLHQADIKRRFRDRTKKGDVSRGTANLTYALREMENRQQQFEQALNGLDQDFDWLGADMMQEILAESAQYYQSLATMIEESNSNANASMALLSQRFRDELERERQQYRQHLQSVMQHLETYERREQSKAETARRWLKQAVAFADFIHTQLDHERFLPGRLARIRENLNFAQNNLAGGFYESSLQTSQQAFLQLSELHFELEQRIIEWQTEYENAYSAISGFITELEMNSKVNAFGLDGEELDVQVDLAYWSHGMYGELVDKCRQLLRLMVEEQRSISTEELRQTHTAILPVLIEKFESMIYEARLRALHSQLRMNIAERALQALETQGFRLNESGYLDQDMHAAFTVNLDNLDGTRVMIEVLPAGKTIEELTNEIVVTTNHPHLRTENEARLQWQELCRSLNQYDLQVSRPEIRTTPQLPLPDPVQHPAALTEPLIRSKRHHNV
jgi:hypothetical protein